MCRKEPQNEDKQHKLDAVEQVELVEGTERDAVKAMG